MKNSKVSRFFGKGRKIVFSLALFLLFFAAVSVVKIQAGTSESGKGWLWGGGTETDGSQPYDSTNTNVGWVSLNRTNCDSDNNGTTDTGNFANCPSGTPAADYGVNVPAGDGNVNGEVTGYAWSERIGWIQFNPSGPYPAAPNFSTKRAGINLEGWARITEIAREAGNGNSGGWQGWVKLNGTAQNGAEYGVTTDGDSLSGYAWSDELGWINFTGAEIVNPENSITLEPAHFDLRQSSQSQTMYATVKDQSGASVSGKTVNFANSNTSRFHLSEGSCKTNASGQCTVNVSASDFDSTASTTISAVCADGTCTPRTSTGDIIQTLACNISCPSSIEVIAGQTKEYDVSVSGPEGCSAIDSCSKFSGSSDIFVSRVDGNTCSVTASNATRFGSAVARSSAGSRYCDTDVNIKGPGWVETNPQ